MNKIATDINPLNILTLCLVATLFASNIIVARLASAVAAEFTMSFWRWFITATVLIFIRQTELKQNWRLIKSSWPSLIVISFMGMVMCGAPIYIAADYTQAMNIGMIMSASPVCVLLLVYVNKREKVRPIKFLGMAICTVGVFLILVKGSLQTVNTWNFNLGDLLALTSMLAWSGFTIFLPRVLPRLSLELKIALFALVGAALNAPMYMLEVFINNKELNSSFYYTCIYIGLFPGALAYCLYGRVIKRAGASSASAMMYLVVAANCILSYSILNEDLQVWHIAGLLLILSGVTMVTWKKH